MGVLSTKSPFWAVEMTVKGLNGKKRPQRSTDSVHSVPGSAYARQKWLEAHHPHGWFAKLDVTRYPGEQLASVLGLPDKS